MKVFIAVFCTVYFLFSSYVFVRGWQAIPSSPLWKIIFSVVFLFLATAYFVSMFARDIMPVGLLKVFNEIGTTWLAYFFYFILFLLVTDLIGLLNSYFHFLPQNITSHFREIQMSSLTVLITIMLVFGYYKFAHPVIVNQPISIQKQVEGRTELRIVGVSDIHLGLSIGKKELRRYVDEINALKPDIVLIAGDLIDVQPRILHEAGIESELDRLQAPLGVYACLGNHEYINGIQEGISFLKNTNIQLLVDSVTQINNGIWLIGRDDYSNRNRKSLKDLVAQVDTKQPVFLLDHQPHHLDEPMNNGVDFQFSGHTHRGQMWPASWIVDKLYEVSHGYKQKNDYHVYVSSGLGIWGPLFRIGTQSEIVVFDVEFTSPESSPKEEDLQKSPLGD